MASNNVDIVIVKLNPDEIVVGDVLAAAAVSPKGLLLAPKGTEITEKVRLQLIRNKASAMVQRPRREIAKHADAAQMLNEQPVTLTESAKNRAKESLQYMYENADDDGKVDDVIDAAKCASSSLLDSVLDSNETRMNVETLKVSDEYTFKHSVDVAVMSTILGKAIGLDENELKDIMTAGILHDFGKIDIPAAILNKPGKLTDDEFTLMKKHPTFGYERIRDSKELSKTVKDGVISHHEKYGGYGYPYGLRGEQIPLVGRIMSIVDVYDALVTKRPYHDARKPVEAYEMMLSMTGQFDLNIFSIFTQTVVLYPNGTPVKIFPDDDMLTVVVKQNPGYPTRPVVADMRTGKTYDLLHDRNLLSVSIEPITI